jgi:DNA-binding IclR family transcriptional regulator
MWRSLVLDAGLDKLQVLLLSMSEGDEVSVPEAMKTSGLPASQCEAVLQALTRAGLMVRAEGNTYVRRHLVE